MSESIEFRCWNAHGQIMHSWDQLVRGNKIDLLANQKPGYPVMQYTGAKDSLGVKIFDNDILRDEKTGEIFSVTWSPCDFGFRADYGDHGHTGLGVKVGFGCVAVVVGNIHQNPELLPENNL